MTEIWRELTRCDWLTAESRWALMFCEGPEDGDPQGAAPLQRTEYLAGRVKRRVHTAFGRGRYILGKQDHAVLKQIRPSAATQPLPVAHLHTLWEEVSEYLRQYCLSSDDLRSDVLTAIYHWGPLPDPAFVRLLSAVYARHTVLLGDLINYGVIEEWANEPHAVVTTHRGEVLLYHLRGDEALVQHWYPQWHFTVRPFRWHPLCTDEPDLYALARSKGLMHPIRTEISRAWGIRPKCCGRRLTLEDLVVQLATSVVDIPVQSVLAGAEFSTVVVNLRCIPYNLPVVNGKFVPVRDWTVQDGYLRGALYTPGSSSRQGILATVGHCDPNGDAQAVLTAIGADAWLTLQEWYGNSGAGEGCLPGMARLYRYYRRYLQVSAGVLRG